MTQKLTVAKWQEKEGSELKANGLIRVNSNKPQYGSIMLLAIAFVMSDSGFMNKKTKVGFVTGEVDQLEDLIKTAGLREGSDYSTAVGPHRIVTLEKVESELGDELGYKEKINPSSGEVLTHNNEPIYWRTQVVADGSDYQDILLSHDSAEGSTIDAEQAEFTEQKEK